MNGAITIAGSGTLYSVLREAATGFQHQHPRVLVQVSAGGSSSGLFQVSQHAIDLGASDIPAQPSVYAGVDLIEHRIAVLPYSIIVNSRAGVTSVSRAQLHDIYTGRITQWSTVGGKQIPIVTLSYPALADSKITFKHLLLEGSDEIKGLAVANERTAILERVAGVTGAIAYIPGLPSNNPAVTLLSIDGKLPSTDQVGDGAYPFWSYEHLYTNGQPSPLVGAFLDYIYSWQVQENLFTSAGLIPITRMRVQE